MCRSKPPAAIKNAILSYGFSFVAVMGGQNSDSPQKLVVNIGCWLVVLSRYACCPCKWRPQSVVHHLMWSQKCYSKLRILICRRRVIPKFWLASKFSDQTLRDLGQIPCGFHPSMHLFIHLSIHPYLSIHSWDYHWFASLHDRAMPYLS